MISRLSLFVLFVSLLPACAQAPMPATAQSGAAAQSAQHPLSPRAEDRINTEVHHQLAMMPNYTLFDIVGYQVQGSTVILSGKVRDQAVKGEAENSVKKIEGVDRVVNNIEVLPPSGSDDHLRWEIAHALAANPALSPYFFQAVPPIHIIVQNGNVDLEGTVSSEGDRNTANIVAKGVPGVFRVTDNLHVEK